MTRGLNLCSLGGMKLKMEWWSGGRDRRGACFECGAASAECGTVGEYVSARPHPCLLPQEKENRRPSFCDTRRRGEAPNPKRPPSPGSYGEAGQAPEKFQVFNIQCTDSRGRTGEARIGKRRGGKDGVGRMRIAYCVLRVGRRSPLPLSRVPGGLRSYAQVTPSHA